MRASAWIRCCVLLHNFILEEKLEEDPDLWLEEDAQGTEGDRERLANRSEHPPATSRLARDHPRRIQLMRDMELEPPAPRITRQRPTQGTQASGMLFTSSLATC